jgi:hypothetical protein
MVSICQEETTEQKNMKGPLLCDSNKRSGRRLAVTRRSTRNNCRARKASESGLNARHQMGGL